MIGTVNIDYKKAMKDIYEGIVTGLTISFIVINLHLHERVMDFVRDIKTSNQAQELLKILDNEEKNIGHVYGEELGWNNEAC